MTTRATSSKRSAALLGTIAAIGLVIVAGVQPAAAVPQPPAPGGAVDAFPSAPAPAAAFDWKKRAADYDTFVYDWTRSEDATIRTDTTHHNMASDTYKMPSYFRDPRGEKDGNQEALNQLASVVGASLVGIDKSDQHGRDYVDMSRTFYHPSLGVALNNPVKGDSGAGSWWYATTANVLYYMLGDLYPDATDMDAMLRSIADKYLKAVEKVGGNAADFSGQGFNFGNMTKNSGTRNEGGDAAAGTAAILLWAYEKFGDARYLDGAKWSMDYLERTDGHLYYEVLPVLSPYIAARMNAEFGTSYDVTRHFENLIGGSTARAGWGTIEGTWNGYDVSGLQGSRTDGGGYAFAMNSFSVGLAASTAKYDPRHANTVGRWLLNVSNSARYLYPDQMPIHNQSHGNDFKDKPARVIPYEGLRRSEAGVSPRATGDPSTYGRAWGLDPKTRDLALYGGSWVGFLGSVVAPTNNSQVLRVDLNATDFFGDNAHPTYLYYNPTASPVNVNIDLAASSSLYDAVSDSLLSAETGSTTATVPPESSRIIVVGPTNPSVTRTATQTLMNGTVVGYRTGTPDLAYGRIATASSEQNGNLSRHLTDGTPARRWESLAEDPQWVAVDLGSKVTVNRVVLRWESASAAEFTVKVSPDNTTWTTVHSTYESAGGVQTLRFDPTVARYVRVDMTARNTAYAYSMYDLEVYRDDLASGVAATASSTVNGNDASHVTDGNPRTRWEPKPSDTPWVSLDLGREQRIDRVALRWAAGSAKSFRVLVSMTANEPRSEVFTTTSGSGGAQVVSFAPTTARFVRVEMTQPDGADAYSLSDVEVYRTNSAVSAPVEASSTKAGTNEAHVTDGVRTTRWESATAGDQSVEVDLGYRRLVGRVLLQWETSYPKTFDIQLSLDRITWDSMYWTSLGEGGLRTMAFEPVAARYVRVLMSEPSAGAEFSLSEFEVYAE